MCSEGVQHKLCSAGSWITDTFYSQENKSVNNYSKENQHSTVPLCRLTWCCCATPIMSPRRGVISCHPWSLHLPQQDTGLNSPCCHCWEEESVQGRHSIPPRPPFGLDTKSTRKFAPSSCLWLTQTRKLFILGQSKRAMGPGCSCTRAGLQMGS